MLIHCINKLEISFVVNRKGKCWDTSDQIQQAVPPSLCWKTLNFALVSTAPARLHCYILEKAQLGLLKPVLTQSYQVFLSYYYVHINRWSLKDTVKCRDYLKEKVESLGVGERTPCAPLAAVQVIQFAKEL